MQAVTVGINTLRCATRLIILSHADKQARSLSTRACRQCHSTSVLHSIGGRLTGWGRSEMVLIQQHASVFRSSTSNPHNARTEHAEFSSARLCYKRVILAISHHPCAATPTEFCLIWSLRGDPGSPNVARSKGVTITPKSRSGAYFFLFNRWRTDWGNGDGGFTQIPLL